MSELTPQNVAIGAAAAAAAYKVAPELLQKLLGPTFELAGGGLRNWSERAGRNIGAVFQSSIRFLKSRIDEPGEVPPKVLKEVLSQAPFCEDRLTTEYFGGVLASSRSEVSRDDRGASYTAIIGRLSTYQIRAHYIIYTMLRKCYINNDINTFLKSGRAEMGLYIPLEEWLSMMDFSEAEDHKHITSHTIYGLVRESLVHQSSNFSFEPFKNTHAMRTENSGGITLWPSGLGIELYCWAHGLGNAKVNRYLLPDTQYDELTSHVNVDGGYQKWTAKPFIK